MTLGRPIPYLPVRDTGAAVSFYRERLGFGVAYQSDGFARVTRDQTEIHLWEAGDHGWRERTDLRDRPVCTGAESFIAGTASCRVEVDQVDALYAEMRDAGALHYRDPGTVSDTEYGTREFAVTDLDNNLLVFFQIRAPASPDG